MARDDLTTRAALRLARIEGWLRTPTRRWAATALVAATVWLLHGTTADPRWVWLAAVPVVVIGAVGGARWGVRTAGTIAVGAVVLDAVRGADVEHAVSIGVRTLALLLLGVLGAVVQRLETERDRALVRSATEDPVTGLLNVRAFYDGLRELRRTGRPFALLLADVVGMHELNERYGHPVGTEALRALGHALRRSVKRGDLVARLGGDEVAIALVGADLDGARAAATRLSRMLREHALDLPDGTSLEVHIYVGIAVFPDHGEDEVALIRAADHAVEDARHLGPDGIGVPDGGGR